MLNSGYMCRMGLVVLALMALVCFSEAADGLTESQIARLDPASETSSVLLETVRELLKNDQLEEALPFLHEVLVRLESDETKKAQQTLAFSLYQLGQCHMKLGDYKQAADFFARFADGFPEDPQNYSARIQGAQCQTLLQNWAAAETQIRFVLEDKSIGDELQIPSLQLLTEALYQQGRWSDVLPPLVRLFRRAKANDIRANTAVMMVTTYVRLGDFSGLYMFLPHCGEEARYNVGLNVALLEAGDSEYNHGHFQNALLLYRLVVLKGRLIRYHEEMLADIKADMKPFRADGKLTLSEYHEALAEKQVHYDRVNRQFEHIKAFPDYDLDVSLRMAQSYGELDRNWPSHAIYRRLCAEHPDHAQADQARFSAFAAMLAERDWAMASTEGYEYIKEKPDGAYIDQVTLNLMQLQMQQEQFDSAYAIGKQALTISPKHTYMDQVKYLMAYARFIQARYAEAFELFDETMKRWPEGRYYEASEYFRSMTLLFLGRYQDAVHAFNAYLTNPRYMEQRLYAEDASYRLGIALYGAERYLESEDTFRAFVKTYPESVLVSEAHAMLGDLMAAEGALPEALEHYGVARARAGNVSQASYPLFQSAKVLELEQKYSEVISLMDDYQDRWGREGDYAQAVQWKSKSFKALDEYFNALDAGLEMVDAYGEEVLALGVDAILRDIVSDAESVEWSGHKKQMIEEMSVRLLKAEQQGQTPLKLRYQAVLAQLTEGAEREALLDELVRSENIQSAGSVVLVLMAREGVKRGEYEVVHAACRRFMTSSERSLDMLHVMSANLDALVLEGNYADAIALADRILEQFGYSPSVGWARKRRGDAFRLAKDYEAALDAYKEVLGIREWRGELTPEALFGSGLCMFEQEQFEEAYAYFQRIYVLYEGYTEWAARAYVKSAECLNQLGNREQEVINTYKEMLANEAIAALPEGRIARNRLRELAPSEVLP